MKLKFDRAELAALVSSLPASDSKVTVVKDDGIYLMSFAQPKESRNIVYARGFNPKTDGDVWDKCRDAVGGDDIGEDCATKSELSQILEDSKGDIIVSITTRSISISYIPKVAEPRKARTAAEMLPFDIFKGNKSGKWRIVNDPNSQTDALFPGLYPSKKSATEFVKAEKARRASLALAVR